MWDVSLRKTPERGSNVAFEMAMENCKFQLLHFAFPKHPPGGRKATFWPMSFNFYGER